MDELDKELIRILQHDARTPFTKIAKELKQADTTIHFRTRKLIQNDIVSRFCALVKPEALGYSIAGLLTIEIGGHILPEISIDRTKSFAEEMACAEYYLWIAVSSEPMTIHALILAHDNADFETHVEDLRKSPDVINVTLTPMGQVVKGWELSTMNKGD